MKKIIFKLLIVLLLIIVGALAVLILKPINIGIAIAFICSTIASFILA